MIRTGLLVYIAACSTILVVADVVAVVLIVSKVPEITLLAQKLMTAADAVIALLPNLKI